VLRRYIAVEKAQMAAFKRRAGGSPLALIEPAERACNLREAEAYLGISIACSRIGDADGAAGAAESARSLDPGNPQSYLQLAVVHSAAGRLDDAAVALIEGAFITSDNQLRQALVELYQRAMDPRSCALNPGPNGPAINPGCPVVHEHVCAAAVPTVKALAPEHADVAQIRKKMFIEQFGCPREPLDRALP